MAADIHEKRKRGNAPDASNQRRQSKRFMDAARDLEADQSEEAFDEALRRIAKAPVRRDRKPNKKGGCPNSDT